MVLELLEDHYKVPAQCVLVETVYYQLVMNEPGVAIPIKSVDEKWEGFCILGEVGLVVDALVPTSKGAVGRPIKRRSE